MLILIMKYLISIHYILREMSCRRYMKVENPYLSFTDGPLLRHFDSKNFVMINIQLLRRVNNVRKQRQSRLKKETRTHSAENGYAKKSILKRKNKVALSNRNSSSKCSPTTSTQIDMGLKSVIVARNPTISSSYSLRSVRKKITASNDAEENGKNGVPIVETLNQDSMKSPPWNGTSTSKLKKLNFMKMTAANRKVRYGWYLGSPDEFLVARKGDPKYQLKDPDEKICFNERKAWAGKYVPCPGQTTLCRLL